MSKDFLAEMLRGEKQQVTPISGRSRQQQIANALVQGPVQNQQQASISEVMPTSLNSLSALDSKEMLARSLIEQSQDRSMHPLARGLSAFMGTKQIQEISAERTKTENALRAAEAERLELERKEELGFKQAELDMKRDQFEMQQNQYDLQSKQFEDRLKFDRDKFNHEKIRDEKGNAITKIPSKDGKVDLLFKGNEPVNDGLEKGQQWGVDKDGNRVAVPIATQASEKAENTKQLTLDVVNRLINNEDGVRGNFGVIDQYTPSMQSGTREAETDLNQLRALLTVENLSLMSGVLSETDIKILQNVAGGGLAETNSEQGAITAIRRIRDSLTGKKTIFNSEEEADKSGLPKGTTVLINGRKARID